MRLVGCVVLTVSPCVVVLIIMLLSVVCVVGLAVWLLSCCTVCSMKLKSAGMVVVLSQRSVLFCVCQ